MSYVKTLLWLSSKGKLKERSDEMAEKSDLFLSFVVWHDLKSNLCVQRYSSTSTLVSIVIVSTSNGLQTSQTKQTNKKN